MDIKNYVKNNRRRSAIYAGAIAATIFTSNYFPNVYFGSLDLKNSQKFDNTFVIGINPKLDLTGNNKGNYTVIGIAPRLETSKNSKISGNLVNLGFFSTKTELGKSTKVEGSLFSGSVSYADNSIGDNSWVKGDSRAMALLNSEQDLEERVVVSGDLTTTGLDNRLRLRDGAKYGGLSTQFGLNNRDEENYTTWGIKKRNYEKNSKFY